MDRQVPIRNSRNNITTEFEYFYQNLLNDISHIHLRQIKTKLRDACENEIPYKHCKTIEHLSKRDDDIVL